MFWRPFMAIVLATGTHSARAGTGSVNEAVFGARCRRSHGRRSPAVLHSRREGVDFLPYDKTIRIWDVQSGEMLRVSPPIGPNREGSLYAAALSPTATRWPWAGSV